MSDFNNISSDLISKGKNKIKKERAKNMTSEELNVMVDEIVNNYDKLYGKLSNTNTSHSQSILWSSIADKLKAVGPINVERSETFMRGKFSKLKFETKSKLLVIKKYQKGTGGGEQTTQLTPLEEKISLIISKYILYVLL
jgi:hypothetical protein